jgi:hypothetical protein
LPGNRKRVLLKPDGLLDDLLGQMGREDPSRRAKVNW